MKETTKQDKLAAAPGALLLLALGGLLLWHSRLSFCQSDESLYLALVHRLWSGDRMILDEWNQAQFYAPLLYPFYALYRLAVPTGRGVYLAARLAYGMAALLCSLLLYRRASGESGWPAAFAAAAIPLLYSRANIEGPSYYNLCLLLSLLCVLCLFSARRSLWFAGGAALSGAVLCNPFLALPAVAALLTACFAKRLRPRARGCALGIAVSAAAYLCLLLSYGRPGELMEALHNLMADPQHQMSLSESLLRLRIGLRFYIPRAVYPLCLLGCVGVLLRRSLGPRAGAALQGAYLVLTVLLVVRVALRRDAGICYLVSVPFALLALPPALDHCLHRSCPFGLALYAAGWMLALAFWLGSTTGLDAMTVGFACASTGGALLLLSGEQTEGPRWRSVLAALLCLSLLGCFAANRFLEIYRDAPVSELTVRLSSGPGAGLYTTPEHAAQYEQLEAELQRLCRRYPEARSVFFSKLLPWAYLSTPWRCGVMTAWRVPLDDPRLESYFAAHPLPDLVILLAEEVACYDGSDYSGRPGRFLMNDNSLEGPFYELLQREGSLVEETPLMRVYLLAPQTGAGA